MSAAWPCTAWAGWQAARRRASGDYGRATLVLAHAAARGGAPAALCRLALLRRDLGHPLPRRWVVPLRAGLGALDRADRRRALGLLAEVAPESLPGLPAAWLDEAAAQPGVAQALGRPQPLADADEVATFRDWVAQARAGAGHLLVGNAASLAGRGLGGRIDAAAAVWRFNRWRGPDARAADQGRRCDVWVLSPEVQDAPIPPGLRWAVVSGPDPRYLVRKWVLAEKLRSAGVPVLTVPLPVWRGAVAALAAPPSAGLLALAWLGQAGWQGVGALGIGDGIGDGLGAGAAGGTYHLADARARPGARHDWAAEAALLAAWRRSGLG